MMATTERKKRKIIPAKKFEYKSGHVVATGVARSAPPPYQPRVKLCDIEEQTTHSPQVSSLDESQMPHDYILQPPSKSQRKVRLSTDIETREYLPEQPATMPTTTTTIRTTTETVTEITMTAATPLQSQWRKNPPGSTFHNWASKGQKVDNAPAFLKQRKLKVTQTPVGRRLRDFRQGVKLVLERVMESLFKGDQWTDERRKEILRPLVDEFFDDQGT